MTKEPNKTPKRRGARIALIVLAVLAAIALTLGCVAYALYWHGRSSLLGHGGDIDTPESLVDSADEDGQTVTYQGADYAYNKNVVSLLFIGVDKSDINHDAVYGKNGQADSLFLAALDTKTGAVKILPISRETMAEVNVYASDGAYIGVQKLQLCLAYAYAATPEEGCENVCRSVQRLLYNIPIDGYVAIDLAGVKALNNAVGGVRVTSPEDLTFRHSPTDVTRIEKGQTITLNDKTVISYIQHRGDDVNANNRRMQRQQQFLNEFIRVAANNVKKNFTLLEKYYSIAKPYAVSDLTLSKITYLASTYLVGGRIAPNYIPVTGNTVMGEQYVEFYPDEAVLYEAVLAAFYTKV